MRRFRLEIHGMKVGEGVMFTSGAYVVASTQVMNSGIGFYPTADCLKSGNPDVVIVWIDPPVTS